MLVPVIRWQILNSLWISDGFCQVSVLAGDWPSFPHQRCPVKQVVLSYFRREACLLLSAEPQASNWTAVWLIAAPLVKQTCVCFEVCQPVDNCTLSSRAVSVGTNQPLETAVLLYYELSQPCFLPIDGAAQSHARVHTSKQLLCVFVCERVMNVASGAASGFLCCCFSTNFFLSCRCGDNRYESIQKVVYSKIVIVFEG